jgi:bisphosphoglycerate-independent phosphoglycerate mutase (AlkP superfamily)
MGNFSGEIKGFLSDVPVTIINLMGLPTPVEMKGRDLLK